MPCMICMILSGRWDVLDIYSGFRVDLDGGPFGDCAICSETSVVVVTSNAQS